MKKLLLLAIMSFVTLTMTQCVEKEEGSGNNGSGNHQNHVDTTSTDEYVDLGLVSMTMWKSYNEKNESDSKHDFFTYDEAVAAFGDKLPTLEQFEELKNSCKWVWVSLGFYRVFGPNNNYILLPAAGFRDCDGGICHERTYGFYWSSPPDGSTKAWYLNFYSNEIYMYHYSRCYANSVRLVKNVQEY